jgi:hypothetical protein
MSFLNSVLHCSVHAAAAVTAAAVAAAAVAAAAQQHQCDTVPIRDCELSNVLFEWHAQRAHAAANSFYNATLHQEI